MQGSNLAEQHLDVPVPRMTQQFVDVPKIVFQDRIQRRTARADRRHASRSRFLSQDRVDQRFIDNPVDEPASHIFKESAEVVKTVLSEANF